MKIVCENGTVVKMKDGSYALLRPDGSMENIGLLIHEKLADVVNVGDFVEYPLPGGKVSVFSTMSGHDEDQTYELGGSRVSQVVSCESTTVELVVNVGNLTLNGMRGFYGLQNILHGLAEAYVNPSYVKASRPVGDAYSFEMKRAMAIGMQLPKLSVEAIEGGIYDSGFVNKEDLSLKQRITLPGRVFLASTSTSASLFGEEIFDRVRVLDNGEYKEEPLVRKPNRGYRSEMEEMAVTGDVMVCFLLKSEVMVVGGEGTAINPYKISV